MSKVTDAVEILYEKMLLELYKKMEEGEATPQDFKLIRDLAKDHGIEFNIEDPGELKELITFPFDEKGNPTDELFDLVGT